MRRIRRMHLSVTPIQWANVLRKWEVVSGAYNATPLVTLCEVDLLHRSSALRLTRDASHVTCRMCRKRFARLALVTLAGG